LTSANYTGLNGINANKANVNRNYSHGTCTSLHNMYAENEVPTKIQCARYAVMTQDLRS